MHATIQLPPPQKDLDFPLMKAVKQNEKGINVLNTIFFLISHLIFDFL